MNQTTLASKIKVLIVDDVLSIRLLLRQIINQTGEMEVIGMAENPVIATELLQTLTPDVITLDVEMPQMDGLTFLKKLMRLKPTPVVMISTLTAKGSADAIKALQLGAAEVIGKPSQKVADISEYADKITHAIRAAAHTKRRAAVPSNDQPLQNPLPPVTPPKEPRPPLIVVGASTGGTEALKAFLKPLKPPLPAILIVQHMPEGFTKAFAARLNELCALEVSEGQHRKPALANHVYIAPGGTHMEVKFLAGNYFMQITDAPPVSRHKPSVNVLFYSAASAAGGNLSAALLTGMGDDGAAGMGQIKNVGGYTLAQDAASSIVYGMPRKAAEAGFVQQQGTPEQLANLLTKHLTEKEKP